MTPTASRLKSRLDERRRWFTNEWFFKWHFIGKDGPVTIDSFDGRGIHYGGIAFSGTARIVFWDTLVRGVRREIDAGMWGGTTDNEIMLLAKALISALPVEDAKRPVVPATVRAKALAYWNRNQGWLGPLSLVIGIASLIPIVF